MPIERIRIALDPTVTTDMVDSASWDLKWLFDGTIERSETNFKCDMYTTSYEETKVQLVHDELLQLRFLVVKGPHYEQVAQEIPEYLSVVDETQAVDRFQSETEGKDKATGLLLLAVICSNDHHVPAVFDEALASGEEIVRIAAVVALGYIGGDRAKALVRSASEQDDSEEVRLEAQSMFKIMTEQPWE